MKRWVIILTGLVFTGFIAALIVVIFVYNKPHPDYEKIDAEYTLTAADLYQAYIANKTGAGIKYSGKVIAINGKLSKVENAGSMTICVFAFNKGMFGDEGLRCTMLPKFREQANIFKPGSAVTIKGYCSGFTDTDVILDKCSIVK